MKTETLANAITYVLNSEKCRNYIADFESSPEKFEIFELGARVVNSEQRITRLLINFRELRGDNFDEDAVVDVQGTDLSNFRILKIAKSNYTP
jgi:hypothetical protein